MEGHFSNVISVAITSDNTKIVSGSRENTIKIWDMNTGKLLNTLQGHFAVAITSDNTKIVSGTSDTIKIWDMNTGKLLNTLQGHSDEVTSVAITSDNTKIVSGSRENTIKVWDLDQLRYYLNNKFDSSISSIALSKSKNLIALGDSSGNLYSGILYS